MRAAHFAPRNEIRELVLMQSILQRHIPETCGSGIAARRSYALIFRVHSKKSATSGISKLVFFSPILLFERNPLILPRASRPCSGGEGESGDV